MEYLKDYMTVEREQFQRLRPNIRWVVWKSLDEQNEHFADDLINRLREAEARDAPLAVVLPTGPIDYRPLVRKVNERAISLQRLHLFMMDEYCRDATTLIQEDHPLSFRGFIRKLLLRDVRPELRMPEEQLLFPDPADPGEVQRRIERVGGLDVVYGGLGVTGHLAFNDPPEDPAECTRENVRNSTTRVVALSRETVTQNAIGGTRGLLELVPPLAVTIGMKEMLAAREIHLYLLRKWHAGVFRRCLFGPVTPRVPGSYLQEHPRVTVHMPEYVARVPEIIVTLDIF